MKIFTKIIGVFLGLSMAAGVGVGVVAGNTKMMRAEAAGETVNFSSGSAGGWSSTAGAQSGTVNGITVACTNGINNGSQLRFYANSTITFTSSVGNITNVTFTATQGNITQTSSGSYSGLTWTGNSANFTMKVGTQIRATNVAVTYTAGGPTLSSIAISGDMTTKSYTTAEDWSFAGLTVTGTYSDSSQANLTSEASFKVYDSTGATLKATPNDLGAGINQTIKVMATVNSLDSTKVSISGINIETALFVSFDATVNKDLNNTTQGSGSISKSPIVYSCDNGILGNGSEYRMYKNSTTTFTTSSGHITSIEFTGVSGNPASGFGSQTGWTTDGNNGTWTGSAVSVSFIASGAQVRATKINVLYEIPLSSRSITFNKNTEDTVTNMPSTLTGQSGTVSLEGIGTPSRTGYAFVGWSLTSSGEIINNVTVEDNDIELFAIWEEIVQEYHLDYTAGTHGSICTVNSHEGIKAGTSKEDGDGDMSITIPSGTTKIKLYIAAWKDASGTVTISGVTLAENTLTLTADNGISNNSPFTLEGDETDFKFELTLSNINSDTTMTISSGTARRFVVWGATDKFASDFVTAWGYLTCDSTGATPPTIGGGHSWTTFKALYNSLDAEEKGIILANSTIIAKYDYIVGKYGYEDFMHRNPPAINQAKIVNLINTNSNSIILVIVLSMVALTSIGGFLVIRKKKEN